MYIKTADCKGGTAQYFSSSLMDCCTEMLDLGEATPKNQKHVISFSFLKVIQRITFPTSKFLTSNWDPQIT